MVTEALVAHGIITIVTVNAPVETKSPQEIKSVSTTIDANKTEKPKAKPKKKKAAKKVNANPVKQQSTKEIAKKETIKSEPAKPEPTSTVSSSDQKSNQSNFLYYILGFLTLGVTSAYFYFRKGSKARDAKIYTSDELKKSLQQDINKSQPPVPDDEVKKS